MRKYMPAPHRNFLKTLSAISNIREYILSSPAEQALKESYNAAVLSLSSFRDTHIQIVSRYIIKPARSGVPLKNDKVNLATASTQAKGLDDKNATGLYGTGGTSLIPFLKQTRDDTKAATC